jgi:hypothetical protein
MTSWDNAGESSEDRTVSPVLLQLEPYVPLLNLSGVVGIVPVFVPSDLLLVLLVPMPLAAIALVQLSHGRWTLNGGRGEPRPSLAIPFLMPSFGILVRVIQDFPPVDWQAPIAAALVAGVAIGTAVAIAEKGGKDRAFFIVFSIAIGTAWGWGVVALMNASHDTQPPRIFQTTLVNKWIRHGKSTTLHFQLAPWGPFSEQQVVQVSDALYYSVSTGDQVCPALHVGAFGWRWYAVQRCAGPM